MTKILPCTCKNEYQDKRYGNTQRVHNHAPKVKNRWRCTVCKDVKVL